MLTSWNFTTIPREIPRDRNAPSEPLRSITRCLSLTCNLFERNTEKRPTALPPAGLDSSRLLAHSHRELALVGETHGEKIHKILEIVGEITGRTDGNPWNMIILTFVIPLLLTTVWAPRYNSH